MTEQPAEHETRSPWQEGLLKGATGLTVGILLSLALAFLPAVPIIGPVIGPYVSVFKAFGTDAGMRIASHWADPPPRASTATSPAPPRLRYVLLDL